LRFFPYHEEAIHYVSAIIAAVVVFVAIRKPNTSEVGKGGEGSSSSIASTG
jgi:hypothetical protein